MKKIATVTPKDFRVAYSKINSIRTANAILPILEHLHFKAFPKGFIITSSNLNTWGITSMKATLDDASAVFVMPQAAVNILNDLPSDTQLEIWSDGKDQLQFNALALKVNFTCPNPAEFPQVPEVKANVTILDSKFETLRSHLKQAKAFTSRDDLKPFLTGVYFTNTSIVGTDAHRMYVGTADTASAIPTFGVIVPKQSIICIEALDEKQEIKTVISDTYISFNDKTTRFVSVLTAGAFPDYKKILPKEDTGIHYSLNRQELVRFLKLALSVSNRVTSRITLTLSRTSYSLTSGDVDNGTSIKLDGEIASLDLGNLSGTSESDPAERVVSFNGTYLLSMLEVLKNELIDLQVSPGGRNIIKDGTGITMLLMALAEIQEPAK